MNSEKPVFFVAGGTLHSRTPSYIERPADNELRVLAASGQLCYVLTTRQMGKSSLMVRTATYFKEQGIHTAVVDLTRIGTAPEEVWYRSLLYNLKSQLGVVTDVAGWWEENHALSNVLRFTHFVQDVITKEVDGQIAIFIDEIDYALNLDFADDFFAAVRYMYNARAFGSDFSQISFVLIGVATPGDLIGDATRTPFNVGERVDLDDFTLEEAKPLAEGLADDPLKAAEILQWIMHWTRGHPYLTQRLCKEVVEQDRQEWSRRRIADLVNETFLGEMSRSDSNLMFVQDMLTKQAPDRDAVLRAYRDVYNKLRDVHDDQQSLTKSHLKLSGVVRRDGDVLRVRNPIYEKVFDGRWIREHLPGNWWRSLPREVKIAAITILFLFVALAVVSVVAISNAQLAQERLDVALSRQLMTQSSTTLDTQYDLALLLGIEALNTSTTPETEGMVRYGLSYNPYLSTYLRAHEDRVDAVSFSSDGELLASGSADGQIILWDMESRAAALPPLEAHHYGVSTLGFSQDGSRLASGSCVRYIEAEDLCIGGEIAIWDLDSEGKKVRYLYGHEDSIRALAFNSDGRILASVGGNRLILWDVATVEQIWQLTLPENESIQSLDFNPTDYNILVYGTESGNIGIVDIEAQAVIQELKGHDAQVRDIEFSPDGELLASGSRDGTIVLWEVATWQPWASPLTAHTDQVIDIEFGADRSLVSVGLDAQVLLWDVSEEPTIELSLGGHEGAVRNITYHDTVDEKILASTGPDNSIILWDLEGDHERGRWLTGHQDSVLGLDFSPDSSVLISAGADQSIMLWDVDGGTPIGPPLSGMHTDTIRRVAFQPQGEYFASAGRDHKVVLWNIFEKQIEPKELIGHTAVVRSVSFSPEGDLLASSDDSGVVILWDVETGKRVGEPLEGHSREVFDIDFSPDGKQLASGSWDGTVRFWDVETQQPLGEPFATGIEQIWDVEFSPNGSLLAVAGSGETVLLINVADRSVESRLLTNQINRINALAFSPDGNMLASGSKDSTIVIWNILDRQIVGLPQHIHSSEVHALAFSPDGRFLASADLDGRILISSVDYENSTDTVCGIVSRNLTAEEWFQYIGPETPYRETCPDLP